MKSAVLPNQFHALINGVIYASASVVLWNSPFTGIEPLEAAWEHTHWREYQEPIEDLWPCYCYDKSDCCEVNIRFYDAENTGYAINIFGERNGPKYDNIIPLGPKETWPDFIKEKYDKLVEMHKNEEN